MNDEFSLFAGIAAAVITFIIHVVQSLSRDSLEDAVDRGLVQHEKMKEILAEGHYPKMRCGWCRTDLKLDGEGRCAGCGAPTCE